MDLITLITGLFFVGSGFLVKAAPFLIAGYNTMPKEQKKNVDIDGLSSFMRNALISMGLSVIVGYFLFKWMGFTTVANAMIFIVTLTGVIVILIKAQKFDHNKKSIKKNKTTYLILSVVIAVIIGQIAYGYTPAKVIVSTNTVKFTGMYGFEIKTSEIEHLELLDTIPTIKLRTNGFSFGAVRKGFFNIETIGKTQLLIHSNSTPYLVISKSSDSKIIINFRDEAKTEQVFNEINALIYK